MKTQIQKASGDYKQVEEMLDIEDSCWSLLTLLWKLDILRYDENSPGYKDEVSYYHQKELVEMLYTVYMEKNK